MNKAYFIGIDIGTQGARVVMLDEVGNLIYACDEAFQLSNNYREEQSVELWWNCCGRLLNSLFDGIKNDVSLHAIKAISVTSTSGTIIPLDKNFDPLHPAIMYSDQRSELEADYCKKIAEEEITKGYKGFNTSSGLPKMLWFISNYPNLVPQLHQFVHATDFIIGRLTGEYAFTDYTNALKSGFSLHTKKWPSYITKTIGIKNEWLPTVIASGKPLARISPYLAAKWNLPEDVIIATGMTDGCASQIASGAVSPGQWNTTIGTTLVIKGVTNQEVIDPSGALYNHLHPAGYWMPGGAGNIGADWVSHYFAGKDLKLLGEAAINRLPGKYLAWPLLQKGERFPFVAPNATGFFPEGESLEVFIACMEGVGFIERYAYERILQLSGEKVSLVNTAGGASNSDAWLTIRSNILNLPVYKMKNVSGAAGAAILAASNTKYNSLEEAAGQMVHPDLKFYPDNELVKKYDEKYMLFINELKNRNIIQ